MNNFTYPQDILTQAWQLPVVQQQQELLKGLPAWPTTTEEARKTPEMQQQWDILSTMAKPETFRQAIEPQIAELGKLVGRRGLPSSTWADRLYAETLGSLWARNLANVLGGYQAYARMVPKLAQMAYYPQIQHLAGLQALAGQLPTLATTYLRPYTNILQFLMGL